MNKPNEPTPTFFFDDEPMSHLPISDKLLELARHNPSKTKLAKSGSELLALINKNEVVYRAEEKAPTVDDIDHLIEHFNFKLLSKAPAKPLMFNKLTKKNGLHKNFLFRSIKTRQLITPDPIPPEIFVIVDGVKRVFFEYWVQENLNVSNVYLDIEKGKIVKSDVPNNSNSLFPIGILYNKDSELFFDYIDSIGEDILSHEVKRVLFDIRNKQLGYDYIITFGEDIDLKEHIYLEQTINQNNSKKTINP